MNDAQDERSNSIAIGPMIRRHAVMVLAVAATSAAVAWFVSDRQEPTYSTAALIQLPDSTVEQQINQTQSGTPDAEVQAETNQILVGSEEVAAATARRLGAGVPASEVKDRITITSEGSTQIVSVDAQGSDAGDATKLANTYAASFRDLQRDRTNRRISEATDFLEGEQDRIRQQEAATEEQNPQAATIDERLLQLKLLEQSDTTVPRVIERAKEPTVADSPKPMRNAALGGLFGLILGVGIAALRQQGDRRLRGQRDAERAYGSRVMATVPRSAKLRRASDKLGQRESEPFRLLQANLRYGGGGPASLVVTSATEGEGKTTTAWNLALAEAASGSRVLFVEGDIRRPTIAARHRLESDRGLVQVVGGGLPLSEAIQKVPVDNSGNGSGPLTVDVLVAGDVSGASPNLLQSTAMDETLNAMEEAYDLVIIDAPPINEVSDTIPLLKLADGAIVVTRMGRTTRGQARRTRELLRDLDVQTLGIVANGATGTSVYAED